MVKLRKLHLTDKSLRLKGLAEASRVSKWLQKSVQISPYHCCSTLYLKITSDTLDTGLKRRSSKTFGRPGCYGLSGETLDVPLIELSIFQIVEGVRRGHGSTLYDQEFCLSEQVVLCFHSISLDGE